MARRPPSLAALALALSLTPTSALATPWTATVVALPPGATEFTSGPVQVRVGEPVTLAVVLTTPDRRVLGEVPSVRLGARTVTPSGGLPEGTTVRWIRVEPRLFHVDRPSPNPGLVTFSNNVLFGPRHGRWLGYDRLEYTASPLTSSQGVTLQGGSVVVRGAHPTDAARDTHGGAGSAWFAAEVTLPDGALVRTPNERTTDRLGLSRSVARVSFRHDDTFLGWLSTYFNVPDVFGSNGPTDDTHQTDRYVGADCADVLIGALRAMGRREVHYTSVAGIGTYASRVSPPLVSTQGGGVTDLQGNPVSLQWGSDILPGDLVAIDYTDDPRGDLPRAWDHIGALVSDQGIQGVLDGSDILRHIGGEGLTDQPFSEQGSIRFVVWRWRPRGARR